MARPRVAESSDACVTAWGSVAKMPRGYRFPRGRATVGDRRSSIDRARRVRGEAERDQAIVVRRLRLDGDVIELVLLAQPPRDRGHDVGAVEALRDHDVDGEHVE